MPLLATERAAQMHTGQAAAPFASVTERAGIGYRELFDAIDQGFCVIEMQFDGRGRPCDYRFLETNAAFEAQTGLRHAVGSTMLSLRPDHEPHWFEIYGEVALTGRPRRFEAPAAALERWFDVYAFPVGVPEERRVGVLFRDSTREKRAEEHRSLVMKETRHRTNNLLAVLSSIINLTEGESVKDYKRKLLGRFQALANSQRFLREDQSEAASLADLVAGELAIHRTRQREGASWEGPEVRLGPAEAQALAMALHELATNSSKYGALTRPEGCVKVAWERGADGSLALQWVESGGPPVSAPAQPGMGTGIVRAVLETQLGGTVAFDWRPEGLHCTISLPAGGVAD